MRMVLREKSFLWRRAVTWLVGLLVAEFGGRVHCHGGTLDIVAFESMK